MRMRINYFGNIISKFIILNKILIRVNISIEIYKDIYIYIQYFKWNNTIRYNYYSQINSIY